MSGVWKTVLWFSSPDMGIAVNSWNVFVKINNALAALCLPLCFPSSLLTFSAASFMHKTVVEELREEVNHSNVSPRLDAVSSGPKSAIFQPLSKNMCSRYSYCSLSKYAASCINYIFHHGTKKRDTLCSALLHFSSVHSIPCCSLFVNSVLYAHSARSQSKKKHFIN